MKKLKENLFILNQILIILIIHYLHQLNQLLKIIFEDFGYKTTKTGFSFGTKFEQYENLFFSPEN